MKVKAKFINCRFVDFTTDAGEKVMGYIPYVYFPDTETIVKCKLRKGGLPDYKFGDDIEVTVELNGRYARYSIA